MSDDHRAWAHLYDERHPGVQEPDYKALGQSYYDAREKRITAEGALRLHLDNVAMFIGLRGAESATALSERARSPEVALMHARSDVLSAELRAKTATENEARAALFLALKVVRADG